MGVKILLYVISPAGLLDPKWIEQRDRQLAEKREQEEVYAAGSSIGGNLKLLAERRTDIFGSGAEEAQIGKKVRLKARSHRTNANVNNWSGYGTGKPGNLGALVDMDLFVK